MAELEAEKQATMAALGELRARLGALGAGFERARALGSTPSPDRPIVAELDALLGPGRYQLAPVVLGVDAETAASCRRSLDASAAPMLEFTCDFRRQRTDHSHGCGIMLAM